MKLLPVMLLWALPMVSPLALADKKADDKGTTYRMVNGPSILMLADAELEYHKARALLGSPTSGYCVAAHYSFSVPWGPETEYWMTIAAENGNSEGMQMLAIRLENGKDPRDIERAKFWRERAARTVGTRVPQDECHKSSD